ncbi:SDR family NAD(P)-dependent oxidoreductase [Amycolatopsis sp. YIM 10]|uniref:SDR family NAD(P)-dependent oxidoreductase n=1 Tax=Amycolatopsis sp. YIM 10 TaxID=2653857 RepID=UPI0012A88EB8|nr:SDR family NAD(P)-dependent oxidoreductase [Amycolatopsis sp. YIM 10]QFU89063.1 short chain dehydrogenase [Amycolatopsis sp. YIM 10]
MPTSTILMTGGGRGLGRVAAERLLTTQPDRHLLLLARDGDRLVRELRERTGSANVSAITCDLASLADIRAAAEEVGRRLDDGEIPPLRDFLGNAGVQMASTTSTTADGFETTFGVNVLANYLLLRLLFDRFEAPGRIVVVGSGAHFGDLRHNLGLVPAPKWAPVAKLAEPGTETASTAGRRTYATSKLAVIYLVHALARRLPEGVDIYTYDPGLVPGTGLVRDASPVERLAARIIMPIFRLTPLAMGPAAAGRLLADTMTGPRPGRSGSYLDRGKVVPSSPDSHDETREEELWQVAARLCALPGELVRRA